MNRKWITNSRTRTALLERYPAGSTVSMKEIEDAYVRMSESKKGDEEKRNRGRHVYLRAVDEGLWVGSTKGWIKVEQFDGIFAWAKVDSFRLDKGVKVKGRVIRFETVSGKMQSIRLDRVKNLAVINEYVKEAVHQG